jgi:hypothetical protein
MTDVTSHPPGTPSWVDVTSSDVAATVEFYRALFGWEAEELELGDGYTMLLKDGRLVAGVAPATSAEQPIVWHTYVSVADASATAAAALEAGGRVVFGPIDVFGRGKMAVFNDLGGAGVSIWEPGTHVGAELVNTPDSFCWNELQTRRPDEAKTFYGRVFGWGERTSDFRGMAYTEWLRDEDSIAGMRQMPPTVPETMPAFWLVYFGVADCDVAVAKATGLGASVLVPPLDSPAGRFSVLQDPFGASLALIALEF